MSRWIFCACLVVLFVARPDFVAGEGPGWNTEKAAKALDDRAQAWFDFAEADLGTGETKTTCVSCHTLMPYALARPALRKLRGEAAPTAQEKRLLAGSALRATHWAELAEPKFGLIYDTPERKRKESLGTEAVFHALILARDDRFAGRTAPSDATRRAFDNLWAQRQATGELMGAWLWLDFGLEPWESKGGWYVGAALAAIAVGSAPGYHVPGRDETLDRRIDELRIVLSNPLWSQNLHNKAWGLWAASTLPGTLSDQERRVIAGRLIARQRDDGGWRLADLGGVGGYVRTDGSAQPKVSDGYATGLVVHALRMAGREKSDPAVAKGLAWLRSNQRADGSWPAESPNVRRDPDSHVGKFLSDAATAMAVLALTD